MELKTGQRVKFRRSHDKTVELTGRILKFHEDSGAVDIETEPDGKVLEIKTIETAHVADVTPFAEEPVAQRGEKGERGLRGLRGKPGESED